MATVAQSPAKAAGSAGDGPYNILFILTDQGIRQTDRVVEGILDELVDDPETMETVELARVGEELTIVHFSLDETGNLVPGSQHRLQRKLRTANR